MKVARWVEVLSGLFACTLVVGACFPRGPALVGDTDPAACEAGDPFDDHTHVGAFDDEAFARVALAGEGDAPDVVDFIVVDVSEDARRHVRLEDNAFYAYHDEWSWFRLLNGEPACGSTTEPEDIGPFASIEEIYAALDGQDPLPLDLAYTVEGRLVSPSFYTLALRTTPRVYATGTLARFDENGVRFAFELAWNDPVTRDDLSRILATVEDAAPDDAPVYFRASSPEHVAVARAIEGDDDDPWRARMLMPGETPPGH